jgi:hypothetical protein
MRYRDVAAVFVEAAEEWGLFDPTLEDAAWACRPVEPEAVTALNEDGAYRRCADAVLSMAQPRRWDRW